MTKYTLDVPAATDEQLLTEVGKRLAAHRIRLSQTQAKLAEQAGIGKRTLERLEAGQSVQLVSLLRVLRAVELLDGIDVLVPATELSPLEMADGRKTIRQRASRPRNPQASAKPWTWGDDA